MACSIEIEQYATCKLYMFMMKLLNYEQGIFDLVLHFTTTITIKTNEDLQMKIDTFFKNCGEGYRTMGCISLWNVFSIKQIDVVFPRKYCCMKDGFKIGNWICQQKPIFKFDYLCTCTKSFYMIDTDINFYEGENIYDSEWKEYTSWYVSKVTNMSIVFVSEKEKTQPPVDKNFRRQRDRITRRVNKTFPKIKSVNKQRGRR